MIINTNPLATAVFPDGDYAVQLYELGGAGGGVVKQKHIYLTAGQEYKFSLDAWSQDTGDAFIPVDLVGSGTTKVMDNLTVTDNGAYETMSASFTVPTTEEYTLWIYSEFATTPQPDLFFDNVQISLPKGTVIAIR